MRQRERGKGAFRALGPLWRIYLTLNKEEDSEEIISLKAEAAWLFVILMMKMRRKHTSNIILYISIILTNKISFYLFQFYTYTGVSNVLK